MKQTDQSTQEGRAASQEPGWGGGRNGHDLARNKRRVDRVRGQERRGNISFVCREHEGKGAAQAGRCGPHESARRSSVVNLPVTWLPGSSTGSACEWEIGRCAGGHERQAALPGVHVNVHARVRGPWRPHARTLQSKNQESFAFICMDWLQQDREVEQNRPGRKKKAPASRGNHSGDDSRASR